jgi:hypothetical protein
LIVVDTMVLTPSRGGSMVLGWTTAQTFLQFRLASRQANTGGTVPQIMEDRPPDMGPGKGTEGDLTISRKEFGRPDQTQETNLNQVVAGLLAATGVVQGNGTNKLAVGLDPLIALKGEGREGWAPAAAASNLGTEGRGFGGQRGDHGERGC